MEGGALQSISIRYRCIPSEISCERLAALNCVIVYINFHAVWAAMGKVPWIPEVTGRKEARKTHRKTFVRKFGREVRNGPFAERQNCSRDNDDNKTAAIAPAAAIFKTRTMTITRRIRTRGRTRHQIRGKQKLLQQEPQ